MMQTEKTEVLEEMHVNADSEVENFLLLFRIIQSMTHYRNPKTVGGHFQ
jgi:hypothetical protein